MALAHIRTSKEFLPTIRYASRTRPKVDKGLPLSPVVFSTFPAFSPGLISTLMEERATLSKRVRKPCYHISLTLPQQDARGFEARDWRELTKDFIERMEMSDRQAVAYLHDDATYPDGEERPHVHLVVNRVGEDGRCIDTSWDFYRAQTALREAEMHLGLTREPSSWEVERRRDPPGQVQRCRAPHSLAPPTIRSQFQVSIDEAVEKANSLDGVADFLRGLGADVRISERGWSLKHEWVAIQGSKLGKAYSAPAVAERAAAVEREPDMAVPMSGFEDASVSSDSELAETIASYALSRSAFDGASRSGSYRGEIGQLDFDLVPPEMTLAIEGEGGTKFEATRQGENAWQVSIDELDDSERQRLQGLPQSVDEVAARERGRDVVRSLQVLAGHEFKNPDGGMVRWTHRVDGKPRDTFEFEISPRADGGQFVTGTRPDSGETVLQATVRDGQTRVTQSDIPTPVVERLDKRARKARQQRQQRQNSRSQDRQQQDDEISL